MIPGRILLIRLSALGDVLLATPAARALARRFPGAQIDWLVEKPYVPLLAGNPHVSPIGYDKRGEHAGLAGLRRLSAQLSSRGYDLVVDLQGKPKTWYLRGVARERLAMRKRSVAQGLAALLGRDPPLTRAHATELFVEALAPLGVEADGGQLELKLTAEMLAEGGAPRDGRRPTVGIAPGARWATKRWPPERFGEVGAAFAKRGYDLLLIGGPGDAEAFAAARSRLPDGTACRDTAKLSVGGLAAAIGGCDLVVTGDSGPSHIASALGVPVVAVFGPTSPARWGPRAERAAVVRLDLGCSPCSNHGAERCPLGHHRCMAELDAATVIAEASKLLGR